MFPYLFLSLSISSLFFHPLSCTSSFHSIFPPFFQYPPLPPSLRQSFYISSSLPSATQYPPLLRLSLPSLSRYCFNNLYYYRRAVFELSGISSRSVAIRQRSWRRFFCAYMLPIRALCATAFCVLLSVFFYGKKK